MAATPPGPWRRLEGRAVLTTPIFEVRLCRFADPRDGSAHERVVVRAPDWVNVIPVTAQGQVVLVRQFRFGIDRSTLEVPGGIVEPSEAPEAAAARELEEETGYRAARLVALGAVHPNPAFQTNLCHIYLAEGCVKVHEGRQDATEDIAVELWPRAELPSLVRKGEISHSLVIAALHLEGLR